MGDPENHMNIFGQGIRIYYEQKLYNFLEWYEGRLTKDARKSLTWYVMYPIFVAPYTQRVVMSEKLKR